MAKEKKQNLRTIANRSSALTEGDAPFRLIKNEEEALSKCTLARKQKTRLSDTTPAISSSTALDIILVWIASPKLLLAYSTQGLDSTSSESPDLWRTSP
jgi:hypothetical protein